MNKANIKELSGQKKKVSESRWNNLTYPSGQTPIENVWKKGGRTWRWPSFQSGPIKSAAAGSAGRRLPAGVSGSTKRTSQPGSELWHIAAFNHTPSCEQSKLEKTTDAAAVMLSPLALARLDVSDRSCLLQGFFNKVPRTQYGFHGACSNRVTSHYSSGRPTMHNNSSANQILSLA